MAYKLTVLMAVHNGLPELPAALESIRGQTVTDFELLIVDDGSDDGTAELLAEHARADARVRVLANPANRGLGFSLRLGVQEARSPWVARMDADDIALPSRLERQLEYLDSHPEVDVLGGWAEEIDGQGRVLGLRTVPTAHERIRELIWTCPFIHPTVLFRRQAILDAASYDPDIRRRQDYDLWFRCAKAGLRFANLPLPLIRYRLTEEHYARNDWRLAWSQMLMGWRGCRLVGAGPVAYLGASVPVIRALLPTSLRHGLRRVLRAVDPRQQPTNRLGA